ncbi:6924_t:CDS:1, partial [Ambispora gerdemannii]
GSRMENPNLIRKSMGLIRKSMGRPSAHPPTRPFGRGVSLYHKFLDNFNKISIRTPPILIRIKH